MKLKHFRLFPKQPVRPVYLISTDEPLLREQALATLLGCLAKEGYAAPERIESSPQWGSSVLALQKQTNLFEEKRLFLLSLTSAKLKPTESETLLKLFSDLSTEEIWIIVSPQLDSVTLNSRWVKMMDQLGIVLQLWAPFPSTFPQWIAQEAEFLEIALSPNACQLLAHYYEGNVNGCYQVLQKLSLCFPHGSLDETAITAFIQEQSSYTPFELSQAWLSQDRERMAKILRVLKASQVELLWVIWAILSDCRLLAKLRFEIEQGHSLSVAFNEHSVWKSRIPLFEKALKTIQDEDKLIEKLIIIEQTFKEDGIVEAGWDALERALLNC